MLQDKTTYFYSFIFPDIDKITYVPKVNYFTNSIKFKNIVIYAKQGEGKTEVVRKLVEEAVKKYGEENVNAVVSEEGDLESLMNYGLNHKLVNILFCDNATLAKLKDHDIRKYFQIRHKWYNLTKRNYGYILSIIACHRFFSIPLTLRTYIDCSIWRNSATSPFDYNIVRKFINNEGMEFLEGVELAREDNPELNIFSVFSIKRNIGLLLTPLADKNYLESILVPKERRYFELLKALRKINNGNCM